MSRRFLRVATGVGVFLALNRAYGQIPAFPGAEGYGRFATGGRGGAVYEVTNLNDSGPGSLRYAVDAVGPRTVVFRVSGNIKLLSPLRIKNGNLTIAGQTAPGDGICLYNYGMIVDADNVIIRYLRARPGDSTGAEQDACWVKGGHRNIILDHCSFSWGIDETLSAYDCWNLTVQWCFITESLYYSYHLKGAHGYGGIWGGMGASFHHNLLAHHSSRTPRFNGSRYHGHPEWEIVDFRNNVVYNWGFNSAYGGEAGNQNLVNNYYKYGPATQGGDKRYRIVNPYDDIGRWFVEGNFVYGFPSVTADNWAGGVQPANPAWVSTIRVFEPFPSAGVVTHEPEVAFELVLADGGASLPRRDPIDERIVGEVRTGSATYGGIWGAGKGIIDSQDQVGGWPALFTYDVPEDQDHDGMADAWERLYGLDPSNPADRNGDLDGDGYTNLEEYLNELCRRTDYLPAPAELRVTPVAVDEVLLQWREAIPCEEGFVIERSFPDTSSWTVIGTVGQGDTLFVDRGLLPDTTYYYRVRAYAGQVQSIPTNVAAGRAVASPVGSEAPIPSAFRLFPPQPNPATVQTVIGYELPRETELTVTVFDARGKMVERLLDRQSQTPGRRSLIWDTSRLPAGVYLLSFQAPGLRKVVRVVVLK
ncbi:MAG: T9SS type A sorting domain-containing protein [candidate division KSB1 bacterium]|nr:T9SS type A sorting domain-containing protein [candidate division KSB1 bacterium]